MNRKRFLSVLNYIRDMVFYQTKYHKYLTDTNFVVYATYNLYVKLLKTIHPRSEMNELTSTQLYLYDWKERSYPIKKEEKRIIHQAFYAYNQKEYIMRRSATKIFFKEALKVWSVK